MNSKRALITGITGQDGSYLAEFLISKGYDVIGMVRRSSTPSVSRISHILGQVTLVTGDITDSESLSRIIQNFSPHEVYNLAAQSYVPVSWDAPLATCDANALGAIRVLEAVRRVNPAIKVYQATSSEAYGKVLESPQNETTPFYPRSPYGVSKAFAYWATVNYRESYNMFACAGILFNHESPRRGLEFVTRKITYHAALIKLGLATRLILGNIDAKRDWGFAGDYVEAMWLMLQQDKPDDFVIATGQTCSVKRFCKLAFEHLDLDYLDYVTLDERLLRPAEVDLLVGDATKAKQVLGWVPATSVEQLVQLMVNHDLNELRTSGPIYIAEKYHEQGTNRGSIQQSGSEDPSS